MQTINSCFGADVEAAAAGKLASWRQGYDALAAAILEDQFTRLPSVCQSLTVFRSQFCKDALDCCIGLGTLTMTTSRHDAHNYSVGDTAV